MLAPPVATTGGGADVVLGTVAGIVVGVGPPPPPALPLPLPDDPTDPVDDARPCLLGVVVEFLAADPSSFLTSAVPVDPVVPLATRARPMLMGITLASADFLFAFFSLLSLVDELDAASSFLTGGGGTT